jgi:diacylglycerol kinase family enzyme
MTNPSQTPTPPRLRTSISLESFLLPKETIAEEKPSIYLFIFVNPLSGDKKGADLVKLPMQHFRLRRFPQIQVEVHNILDKDDRELGIKNIQLVESIVVSGKIPPNPKQPSSHPGRLSDAAQSRHIHVWSAGGDGTVMSVFELLVSHKINLDLVFFSCNLFL